MTPAQKPNSPGDIPLKPCPGCGGLFPDISGPTHRYMESSPGCFAAYGEVLAREYQDPTFADVYRMSVDVYAVQHPGTPSPQSIQSVAVHLMRLCFVLERNGMAAAQEMIESAVRMKDEFVWLAPPVSMGPVTVADVLKAVEAEAHRNAVRAWAESAWKAWSAHHDTIRRWLDRVPWYA